MNTPRPEASLIGRSLSHYKVVSLLGAGGMGEVYLSHDDRLNRPVALKTLRPDLPMDDDRMQRFVREAKAASALNHPNVATIYDVGESGGIRFIAMEYVEGSTLAERIGGRPLDPNALVNIGIQMADALGAAHEKGITHRDVKPANVMITNRGQVKVLDFGLAKVTEPGAGMSATNPAMDTATGLVVGSLQYMSPEQVLGRGVDHRSDIFSFGTTLYEMATGRLPFSGKAPTETMDSILHRQPDAITRVNPRAPAELERIVRKCLEKDRDRRYSSVRDVLVDLKNLQRDSASAIGEFHDIPRSRKSLRWVPILALAASGLLTAAFVIYRVFSPEAPLDSIMVLPFVNNSNSADADALSDGIPESLINSLSLLPKLRVISRPTAFSYRGKSDLRQIARELNVRAVLTGRLVQRGDSLNIQAELTDGATMKQIWFDQFDNKLTEILTVQDDIVSRITDGLRLKLNPEEHQILKKRHTDNPEAYRLYLQGRHYSLMATKVGFQKSLELFRQALELDPNYALAHAGIAETYLFASDLYLPSREAGAKAKEAAITARTLDDMLSEAHCAMAIVSAQFDWDWGTADREFQKARKLDPTSGCVNDSYGIVLAGQGRFNEALSELNRALQVDPHNMLRHFNLAIAFYFQEQYGKAIEELDRASSLDPGYWFTAFTRGCIYEQMGRYKQALDEYEKLPAEFHDAQVFRARGLALTGQKDEAKRILEQERKKQTASPWGMAAAYAALGDTNQALELLQKSHDERFIVFYTLKVEPLFKSLRSNPQFEKLVRSTGLESR